MEKLKALLEESINERLYQIILSNARHKEDITKVKVRPILQKEKLMYQASSFSGTKVFHRNYEGEELTAFLEERMAEQFKQMEITSSEFQATVLVSRKGQITIKKKQITLGEHKIYLAHNREKRYILEEAKPVGFLIDLGIQTKEGFLIKSYYDKFKQINRFLEFIEDVLPILQKEKKITIIDFGCGKSYLTFAMYYYLRILQKLEVSIVGLDLKEDVIASCNALKEKYGYDGLVFQQGDIADYDEVKQVTMVVTLHACDTATDYALQKAVAWGAKVILSVPCCQHEMNRQMKAPILEPVLKYGLIKERMAALFTDAIRADILEENGYRTQILEFIDMEHTPKNILIRAVKQEGMQPKKTTKEKTEQLDALLEFLQVNPTLRNII